MADGRKEWSSARDDLVLSLKRLGFPSDLGEALARQIGSPKGIIRMSTYLDNESPTDIETIVDEALAIRCDIDTWRKKKEAEEANAGITAMLNSDWMD